MTPPLICPCTICGCAVPLAAGSSESNALCPGCLPNLRASLDWRLAEGASWVPEPLYHWLREGDTS